MNFSREYCLSLRVLHCARTLLFFQVAICKWMEEALFLFKENHECYTQEGQEPCLALWIQLAGYRNWPTSQCFHGWGISPLCKITPFKWMEDALHHL
jgi:hypothetical protein